MEEGIPNKTSGNEIGVSRGSLMSRKENHLYLEERKGEESKAEEMRWGEKDMQDLAGHSKCFSFLNTMATFAELCINE